MEGLWRGMVPIDPDSPCYSPCVMCLFLQGIWWNRDHRDHISRNSPYRRTGDSTHYINTLSFSMRWISIFIVPIVPE